MRPLSLIRRRFLTAALGLASAAPLAGAFAQEKVNLYTHRHYEADQVLFKKFTADTGIEVNVVKAGAQALIERLKSEGAASPADLLVTADAGNLVRAKAAGLLQAVESDVLTASIPETLRDTDGQWFGLTRRARIIAYAKERVQPSELSTYEALANAEWRGRILCRSSSNIYNQSLLASIIANSDKAKGIAWATAVRKNMARPPQGSDRDQMRAVSAGLGDVAIVNTYYLGLLINSTDPQDQKIGRSLGIFFPNQEGRGAHVNISGAGVTKSSKNKENAIKLLEFLVSVESQKAFAEATYEYPVNPKAELSELLKSWGEFKADPLDLNKLGTNNAEAVKAFDLAGWE